MIRVLLLFFFIFATPAPAGEEAGPDTKKNATATSKEDREVRVQANLQVLGSREQAEKTPGSAHYISKGELEEQGHTDIHRVLRQIPGVYMQEEDGLGLRPNIGFRGTGVERSQKITLLEDGVLIAPAPYTAPAAYYFPSTGRMESIEVLKGPSTVTQGPFSNGGALNMVSASIPGDFSGDLSASAGSHGTKQFKVDVGNRTERFGWLVETFQLGSDGFKKMDGGGNTGTRVNDYMAKLRYTAAGQTYQFLELKLGKTKQFGHETYLGLTESDFEDEPLRRYAGSQQDYIDSDHEQFQLRHYIQIGERTEITSTAYYNDYYRNWHKMEGTLGVSNATILANPEQYADHLGIIRGEIDSPENALRIRNNRRNYLSQGIQTTVNWHHESEKVSHQVEASIRYHEDEEDRFQHEEGWSMTSGEMRLTSEGALGSQTNRLSSAKARSGYITDTASIGNWTIRPGVRFEQINYSRLDYLTTDPDRSQVPSKDRQNQVSVALPGLGLDYKLGEYRYFLGIYRGFSPPGAGANQETREERSTNYEFGLRHRRENFSGELVGFYNDYKNLLGAETVSGGGSEIGELYNGGEVRVNGLEASFSFNLVKGHTYSIPLTGNYTYTDTAFQTSFDTRFADWGPHVEKGDELPYIPKHQVHLELGLVKEGYTLNMSMDYSGEMRTKAGQDAIPVGQGTDARFVLDFSGSYHFGKSYSFFARLRNLTDRTYIVARRPYGLRPGLNRTLHVGIKARF